MKLTIIALLTASLVTGCAVNKEGAGTVLGGAVGVALGSMIGGGSGRTAAMVLGGIFGAVVGNNIGSQLDEKDKQLMVSNTQQALENNRTNSQSTWQNPDTQHSGTTTPVQTYTKNNEYCRKFTQTIYIDGKREIGEGSACRNSNGNWILQ